MNFADSTLLMSLRSPFARRVRLAFREAGLRYEERPVDVLKPTPELVDKNPLGRVPALLLKEGGIIVDSSAILDAFYEANPSPLFSGSLEERTKIKQWSTLAVGVAEKTVEYYFETLRPEASRDSELLTEISGILERVLGRAEKTLASQDTLVASGLTQADLDFGTALRYLCVRRSSDWRSSYPSCSRYLERLEKRPSFRATEPPPA